MRVHNPPHPGAIIKTLCLEPLGVTVTHAAQALGVSRKTLSAILNGRAGISPEMAVSLYCFWYVRRKLAQSANAVRSLARRAAPETITTSRCEARPAVDDAR